MDNNSNKPQKKKNTFLFIVIGIMTAVIVAVSLLFLTQKKEMDEIIENLNEEKAILTGEYYSLMLNYDSLHSDNETINKLLEEEREKITQLIEEIKTIKATNTAKIREFQKELTTLRGVLKSYVVQIDSLNTRNQELTKENVEMKKQVTRIETSFKKLENEKAVLEEKVSIASQLDITNLMADALGSNGKKTDKFARAAKIRVCFTVLKNVTAPIGSKKMYLRIERPDGDLLMQSKDDLFSYENKMINYSAMRAYEYGGEEIDVCIFYNVDVGELMKGNYTADVFADGFHIGSVGFTLK